MPNSAWKLFFGALAAFQFLSGQARSIEVFGRVLTASGLSGTAADSPSYSSLAAYRWDYPYEVAKQNTSPNPLSSDAIYPANAGLAAFFLSEEMSSDQWVSTAEAGQTTVAVAETIFGQYTWAAENHVAYGKKIINAADLSGNLIVFAGQRQWDFPVLSCQPAASHVSLSWTALPDADAIISSYTIYRATYSVYGTYQTYGTNEILDTVAAPLSGSAEVDYLDNAVTTGTTYYYTLAVNIGWPGVVSATAGARPDQPFYTTFGQSQVISVTAQDLSVSATPTPTASATPSSTATDSPTATATDTSTPSPSQTPPFTDTDSPTATPTVSPSGTPTWTTTATPSATPTGTATETPTPSPTEITTFSPSATPTSLATSTPALFSGEVLAPVPAHAGEMLCLYSSFGLERTRWKIYDVNGSLVSVFEDRSSRPCLRVPGNLRGVVLALLEITRADGQVVTRVFKIAVLP